MSELKIPLIIDGVMLVFVIFMAGGAWFRMDALASDVSDLKSKELPERVVRIETEVRAIARTVDSNAETLKDNQRLMVEILREVKP